MLEYTLVSEGLLKFSARICLLFGCTLELSNSSREFFSSILNSSRFIHSVLSSSGRISRINRNRPRNSFVSLEYRRTVARSIPI